MNNCISGKKVKTVTNILGETLLLGWSEERESFEKMVFMEMEGEKHSFQAGVEQVQSWKLGRRREYVKAAGKKRGWKGIWWSHMEVLSRLG